MTTDLTLAAARADRDHFIDRMDAIDKVGALVTLPDDMHCTTDMVATFYEVPRDTISAIVSRNRDELDEDGYRVVTRSSFEGTYNMQVPSSASRIALFPRRAVLRVGMLLRDSIVARRVRDYLLDSEKAPTVPDITTPAGLLAMTEMFRDTAQKLVAATEQIEAERPLVERAKTHAGGAGTKTRQQFFRELKQWAQTEHGVTVKQADVVAFLSTRKLGLFVSGARSDTGQATAWAIEHGYAENREGTAGNGHNFATGVLTARGQAYAWDRCVRYLDANGTLTLPPQIGAAS